MRTSASLADYERGESVGRGSYGVVYRGVHRRTGAVVALKKIGNFDDGVSTSALREIAVLLELEHPNIIKYV